MCVSGASASSAAAAAGPAGLVLQGASAVAGAVGSYYTAKGQKIALESAADTARANAKLAQINAKTNLDLAGINNDVETEQADINARSLTGTAAVNAALTRSIGELNAGVAEGNAKIARAIGESNAEVDELNAQDALRTGQRQEQGVRLGAAQLKSTQRANLAANGIALDEGSAVHILTSTDYMRDVDVETIQSTAYRAAAGFRVQAVNDRIQGMIGEFNANQEAAGLRRSSQVEAFNIESTAASTALNTTLQAKFNAINRTQQARLNAVNSAIQATGLNNTARAQLAQADGISPLMAGANSLLAGGAAVASKWYNYSKSGAI